VTVRRFGGGQKEKKGRHGAQITWGRKSCFSLPARHPRCEIGHDEKKRPGKMPEIGEGLYLSKLRKGKKYGGYSIRKGVFRTEGSYLKEKRREHSAS